MGAASRFALFARLILMRDTEKKYLLNLEDEMNKSQTISELAKALIKVQKDMPPVEKNATNPFLKNKYADLGSTIRTSTPVLTKHGLSLSQFPTSEDDRVGLTSILMHISGEWIEDTIYLPPERDDNKAVNATQTAGKQITYLRRYAWSSILGMNTDDDNDGNGHQSKTTRKSTSKAKSGNGKMSLEMAEKVKNTEGVPYGKIESEKLSHMATSLSKSLKGSDLSDKDREERELKRDAALTILASRNG
jgi:hypothetical protein